MEKYILKGVLSTFNGGNFFEETWGSELSAIGRRDHLLKPQFDTRRGRVVGRSIPVGWTAIYKKRGVR